MNPKSAFTPTSRMIAAVETYLAARLCEEEFQAIVIGYETEILSRHRFKAVRSTKPGQDEIILDPKHSYRISEADSDVYFAECRKARVDERITIEGEDPDTCPLLKARHALLLAENEVIKSMSDLRQLASLGDKLYVLKLEDRRKLIELSLGLIAPFVNNDRTIRLAHATLVTYPRFAAQARLPR
ncbi:hypothetical protein [Paraburkholderia fungorum]|uniref:hypothetical protein n=1 Tax=Paraburkholderia fungorum TaxID=134537 RepID=UPI000A648E80|nr:hypothetical protein [Paraburkholderia fungorum]